MKTEKKLIRGIVPPLVTPLNSDGTFDEKGLEKLLNHVIGGGVHGVFILGTTGEFASLGYTIKKQVIEATCRLTGKRVPVLAGITDTSKNESLRLAEIAYRYGADAVVLAPPFYYYASQSELLDYFGKIAEKSPLPVFLYNIPSTTKIFIEAETVYKAAQIPGIIGIKDSSANAVYFHRLKNMLKEFPEFTIFVGTEEILAETVLFGAHGGVAGGANMFPGLFADLFEAAKNKDLQKTLLLQDLVTQISDNLYRIGAEYSNYVKIVKYALSEMGICQEYTAAPFLSFSENEKKQVASCIKELNRKISGF